ncbi:hypothetical protein LWI29_021433 [Acer saccharum]|uniref:Polyprotein n=1 Tax=Acer saccharum TaxID=4024 RepID=A0AA39S4N3_ACESA|nr:hypothetical protein LWI29_021433 [Acer saccharum]
MANNTSLTPPRLSSSLSITPTPSIRRTLSRRIENLVEYSHIPQHAQINDTSVPLLNPYNIFKRNKSMVSRMTRLVSHRPLPVKEYVQSTGLDNCLIPSTSAEQYVDLEIGQPMINHWINEGYSHLHISAVRLILTLHGRKGIPVTAKVALLNTIYKDYEQAVIGTCLSTLHAGSISLTYYPNFNIPLRDPNLNTCLKVQIQLTGATLQPNSFMATLHHQLAYRLQDHALDLPIPSHTGDTLFIKVEREDDIPTIIQIPKQLPRDKLLEIMPLEWISNYEKAFQNTTPVVASESSHKKRPDGSILTTFTPVAEASSSTFPTAPPIFQALLIKPVTTETDIPIHSFEADGTPIFTDKINGHFIWDDDYTMCDPDCDCRECLRIFSIPCKPAPKPQKPDRSSKPWIGLHPIKNKPLPIYDRVLQILRSEGFLPNPEHQIPVQ